MVTNWVLMIVALSSVLCPQQNRLASRPFGGLTGHAMLDPPAPFQKLSSADAEADAIDSPAKLSHTIGPHVALELSIALIFPLESQLMSWNYQKAMQFKAWMFVSYFWHGQVCVLWRNSSKSSSGGLLEWLFLVVFPNQGARNGSHDTTIWGY